MNLRKWLNAGLLVLLTAGLAGPFSGAAADDAALRLDDITVMASPIIEGNMVDRYGAQKTVVTEEQMRQDYGALGSVAPFLE
jgi:iron complex outermembrane receptor protein